MNSITKAGSFIALAGIISSLLSLVNMELRILMWIDMWGVAMGWAVRIGLIVVGGALYFIPTLLATQPSDEPLAAETD